MGQGHIPDSFLCKLELVTVRKSFVEWVSIVSMDAYKVVV